MGLNTAREKERQEKLKSGSDSKTFKLENGHNVFRVLKFKHKVTKEDVAVGMYGKQDIGKTEEEWCYPFTLQYGLVAENRNIPIAATKKSLDIWKTYNKSAAPDDKKIAMKIKPSNKFAINIVDINHPETGVQVFLASKTVREFIGKYVTDPDFGEIVLGVKGRDFKVEFNSKAKNPKEFYPSLMLMDKEKSRAMNSKVETQVKDLFDPEINSDFTGRVQEEVDLPDAEELPTSNEDLEGRSKVNKKAVAPDNAKDDIFDAE